MALHMYSSPVSVNLYHDSRSASLASVEVWRVNWFWTMRAVNWSSLTNCRAYNFDKGTKFDNRCLPSYWAVGLVIVLFKWFSAHLGIYVNWNFNACFVFMILPQHAVLVVNKHKTSSKRPGSKYKDILLLWVFALYSWSLTGTRVATVIDINSDLADLPRSLLLEEGDIHWIHRLCIP